MVQVHIEYTHPLKKTEHDFFVLQYAIKNLIYYFLVIDDRLTVVVKIIGLTKFRCLCIE